MAPGLPRIDGPRLDHQAGPGRIVGPIEYPDDLIEYVSGQPRQALWFSGHSLTWIRASGSTTGGRLSLVEHIVPAGSASPWHVHRTEDESFYVVSGAISVKVEGQPRARMEAGGFAFGPKGVPHAFRTEADGPSRILLLTDGPAFADFIAEASDAVDTSRLPEPGPPDPARLKAAAARYQIEILGPPSLAGD